MGLFTYDNLVEQFPFFSKSTIRRAISSLEKCGLLLSKHFNKMKMDQTKWYSIDYEILKKWNNGYEQSDQIEIQERNENVLRDTEQSFQNEQMVRLTMNSPIVQSEQVVCSNSKEDVLNLNRAIPKSSTESTPKNTTETSSTNIEQNEGKETRTSMNPFRFYEQNGFGTIGGFLAEKITAWCIDLSDELVIEAMKIALANGSMRWNYVEAILTDWVDKGYQTIDEVNAARLAYKAKQKHESKNKKPLRQEIVPEWLQNDDPHPTKAETNQNPENEIELLEERIKRYIQKKRDSNGYM